MALAWLVVFLFSTTLHEASHAFLALRLGDPTAYRGGQVSLNPLPHVRREPVGMLLIPLLSFFIGGWMIGWASAPYDPSWAHRHPKRAAIMALGGPAANLLLVIAAGGLIRVGLVAGIFTPPDMLSRAHLVAAAGGMGGVEGVSTVLSILFSLNLLLFTFNLLPLPPMDGSAAIQLLMSDDAARALQKMLSQPMIGWMGILIAWQVFPNFFGLIDQVSISLLYPDVTYR